MSGIRLDTLIAAHEALMRVWRMPMTEPVPYKLRAACMDAAVALKVDLEALGMKIEVKVDAPVEKVAA